MPPENELKREMIELLLSSSKFDFDKVKDITKAAEILTDFILEKNQSQEPHNA